jgi:hypothetical protein
MSNRGSTRFFAFFDDTVSAAAHVRNNPSWEQRYSEKRYKILGFVKKGRAQYAWENRETIPMFQLFRPTVTMGELQRRMRVKIRTEMLTPVQPKKVYIKQEGDYQGRIEIFWVTRTSIWYECQQCWIPVLGALNPDMIMGNYLYEAEPDSYDMCFARQLQQQADRVHAQRLLEDEGPVHINEGVLDAMWHAAAAAAPEPPDEMLAEAIRQSLAAVPVAPAPAAPSAPAPRAASQVASQAAAQPLAVMPAPRHVLDLIKRDAVSKGDCCPISMTPFQECESTTITSCFHLFETESIRTWLSTKDSCPVCKQKVTAAVAI